MQTSWLTSQSTQTNCYRLANECKPADEPANQHRPTDTEQPVNKPGRDKPERDNPERDNPERDNPMRASVYDYDIWWEMIDLVRDIVDGRSMTESRVRDPA